MTWAALAALATLGPRCDCGKKGGKGGGVDDAAASASAASAAAAAARTPQMEALWTAAKDGDPDELARLADAEGGIGLVERAGMPAYRLTALRAMGYADGFVMMPVLGDAARHAPAPEATAAAESAARVAARKRAQTDPEDAEELFAGCADLLAAAKDTSRPRPVRIDVIRALRMLVDYGCVHAGDIPTDLDVK